jgi:hypothetical protein
MRAVPRGADRIEVRLTWPEVQVAAQVGILRNVECLRKAWKQRFETRPQDTWSHNIEGACGELAVAKHLDLFWAGNVGEPDKPDVGPYDVRANLTRGQYESMRVRPDDKVRPVISVLSYIAAEPIFYIRGWMWSDEAKQERWWHPPQSSFLVPCSELYPMARLPAVEVVQELEQAGLFRVAGGVGPGE